MLKKLTVLSPRDDESWNVFSRRIHETAGDVVVILAGSEQRMFEHREQIDDFLAECAKIRSRLRLATKHKTIISAARRQGIRVLDRTRFLKEALAGHESAEEALRVFSPHVWRQELRSRLQAMGLLSLPKIRIWFLIGLSVLLFFFVLFRLLPSSEIQIWPREDTINQTANIFLVLTGATVDIPVRVRTMPLIPIVVTAKKALTFDQISKQFTGKSAEVPITIINAANETYSFRKGTRLMNQAGMIFRTQDPINVPPGGETIVRTKADDLDLYGEVIGDRGNLPAGLKWEFPGLAPEERIKVFGENRTEAIGGSTAFRTVLQQSDLDLAKKRLEQELLATAKQLVEEERTLKNMGSEGQIKGHTEILYYEELTKIEYFDFVLPSQFLGEAIASIPVEGKVRYFTYAYDAQEILDMLSAELESHVGEGKRLLEDTLTLERMIVHVMGYDDNLSWIKLTVDLTGTEQFVLDPLTPAGAKLGKKVREAVAGMSIEEAIRIVKNFPEVERVDVVMWPPWQNRLPKILSHITIAPQK